jgi:riboflavin synthase
MFTGTVQTVGVVRSIRQGSTAARLALDAPGLTRPIPLGSSIAVNGACLTVAACDEARVEFDVIPETLARSTLGGLTAGARVNLERALRAGDPLDGHMVQGHVDGIATLRSLRAGGGGHVLTFRAGAELMPFIIPKGSIAIDGVSLTIASVETDTFSVALIPTTLAVTTLGLLKVGDKVNIETDILARTIVTTLRRLYGRGESPAAESGPPPAALTVESLRENGW